MLSNKIEQRTGRMCMQSPYMQQSLKILQMNNAELLQHINNELMQIPFLQLQEEDAEDKGSDNDDYKKEEELFFTSVRVASNDGAANNWQDNYLQTQISLREHLLEQVNILFEVVEI